MTKLIRNASVNSRSFAGTYIGTMVIQLSTLLQSIITARLLGPEGRGELATILLWPIVLAGFGYPGFATTLGRLAGQPNVDLDALQKSGLKIALLWSSVVVVVGYILIPFLLPPDKAHLVFDTRLYLVWVPLNFVGICLGSIDQGSGNFKLFNTPRVALFPMNLLFFAVAYLLGVRDLTTIVSALIIISLVVVIWRLRVTIVDIWHCKVNQPLSKLLSISTPYITTSFFDLLNKNMDKILLALLLSVGDMGLYVVALSAASIHSTLSLSIGMVSFTKAAQSEKGNRDFIAQIFRYSIIMNALFAVFLAILIYFAIPLVYGESFRPSIKIAYILLIGTSLSGLTEILDQFLRGIGHPLLGLSGRLISIGFLLALGLPLVLYFGPVGIALSYTISQFIVMAWIVAATARKSHTKFRDLLQIRSGDCQYFLIRLRAFLTMMKSQKT